MRAVAIAPVGLNLPVEGSYRSAEAVSSQPLGPHRQPPAMRTNPSRSRVAVCESRARAIDPVGLNLPVAGSYSSAEARLFLELSSPPAMRTRPSESLVAV